MAQTLLPWWQARWKRIMVGIALWGALAAAAGAFAASRGLPLWETVVTWDEWFVAIALFVYVPVALGGPTDEEMRLQPTKKKLIYAVRATGLVLLVVFLLDLLVRLVFGLGWEPF